MIYEGTVIGTISEESNDAGEKDWVIKPDWEALKTVSPIQIAGIDMEMHLDEYVRTFLPAFIEERVPPETREGLWDFLEHIGMNYYDPFDVMCKTKGICGCNNITVEYVGEFNPDGTPCNPPGWADDLSIFENKG